MDDQVVWPIQCSPRSMICLLILVRAQAEVVVDGDGCIGQLGNIQDAGSVFVESVVNSALRGRIFYPCH